MNDFLPFVVSGLVAGSVYGLAANGLVLTYKTSGIFNFAHGTVAAFMAYAFFDLRVKQGVPWPIALLICLGVLCPLTGILLELVARRVASAAVVMNIVATVGLLVAVQQIIIIRYGAAAITSPPFLPTSTFALGGVNIGYDQLIVTLIAIAGTVALTVVFARTRLGRAMSAVVDQPDLLALMGTTPRRVRRQAWIIGTFFAGLSGILLAPTTGLDAPVLTLLVVQAFGAAAIGRFTSLPATFLGALGIGIVSSLSTKYVVTVPWLGGLPSSVPFLVLFGVLVFAKQGRLVDFTANRKQALPTARSLPRTVKLAAVPLLVVVVWKLPSFAGAQLPVYTSGLAYVLIFLSLALLLRTSGQVSLGQLAFAAVGAVAAARLSSEAGLPWVLAILLGALFAVPVGGLLAVPAVRRSGLYLALATFGFGVLLERLTFGTGLMFNAEGTGSLKAPRPGFAQGDNAYFYLVACFVGASVLLVLGIHRSRLGRLLRAMSDSPTALKTFGTNVTAVKVIVFCISAFLAGLGGALIGPVTESASPANFNSFGSLLLLVVLVITVGSEITASIGAAAALIVIPAYVTNPAFGDYFPLFFGATALFVAMKPTDVGAPAFLARASRRTRRAPERHPALARVTAAAASKELVPLQIATVGPPTIVLPTDGHLAAAPTRNRGKVRA